MGLLKHIAANFRFDDPRESIAFCRFVYAAYADVNFRAEWAESRKIPRPLVSITELIKGVAGYDKAYAERFILDVKNLVWDRLDQDTRRDLIEAVDLDKLKKQILNPEIYE